ncbi:hypothetical protein [Pontibacter akesuensis]|uniref:DUF4369 domain-containing protein n=1 Tax=Pontibacter akesuensis TaxID=388950 RepID=A0A1I7K7D4_9BACT|nr:hypothetical protein [Pontibacter akesuensis]GHA74545.1 hypothetical protein GCM10007389_30360 [Pontibacter akesuensis]SFU93328.1 hypothetical protein SAMN04487941_3471 [Pontibacter akesuensis]
MKTQKSLFLAFLLLLAVLATPALGQSNYKGLPLLKANSSKVNVRVGDVFVSGFWTVKPEYTPNSLHIQVNGQKEKLVFYTDIDSATYEVRPEEAKRFYVLLNKQNYVLTEVKGFRLDEGKSVAKPDKFLNIAKPRSKTFGTLWEKHHVGEVVNEINEYADKASGAVNWAKGKLFGDQ